MQAETNCTSSVSTTVPEAPPASAPEARPASILRPRRPSNAFSDSFLVRARCLEQPQSASAALLVGPWDVEEIAVRRGRFHAVVRRGESLAEGGSAFAVLLDRTSALLLAAALPALARPDHLHHGRHRKRPGVPLRSTGGGQCRQPLAKPPQPAQRGPWTGGQRLGVGRVLAAGAVTDVVELVGEVSGRGGSAC